jgi:cell division septum initiation protein DivIVA
MGHMAATHRTSARTVDHHEGGPRVVEPDAVEREGAGFDLAMRGYARDQVEHRIHEWATAYDALEIERDQLLAELGDLRARPQQLTPLASMSARVAQIVDAAEVEASEALAAARHEADAILAEAQQLAAADLEAAHAERTVAQAEADRLRLESQAAYEQLVGEAQDQAQALVTEAQARSQQVIGDAQTGYREMLDAAHTEVARLQVLIAAEENERLSAARLEAEELARTTHRQREIAENEHERLLAAHASQQRQQRQIAAGLRAEVEELLARRNGLAAELAAPPRTAPVAPAAPPITRRAVPEPMPMPVAVAGVDAEVAPLETFMHRGDTGEVWTAEPVEAPESAPAAALPRRVPLHEAPIEPATTPLDPDAIRNLRRRTAADQRAAAARKAAAPQEPITGELPEA